MNIDKSITQFLDNLSVSKAKNTWIAYASGVKVFRNYLVSIKLNSDSPVECLTMDIIIGFTSYLGRRGYSKSTTGVYMGSLRAYIEDMIIAGSIAPTYQETLRFQKAFKELRSRRESKLPRFPKKDDVKRMTDAAHSLSESSPRKERNIAIIESLASTGCRIGELSKLDINKIDLSDRSAVVTGKGSKERVVYFSSEAIQALLQYWKARGDQSPASPVFCRHDRGAGKKIKRAGEETIWIVVKNIMKIAGIEDGKFSPHYFRHAFAINMLKDTGNLALVQDLLGHANPQSTRVYAKIYPEDLRDAHHKVYK
jgi:site-specific recombinase XerD